MDMEKKTEAAKWLGKKWHGGFDKAKAGQESKQVYGCVVHGVVVALSGDEYYSDGQQHEAYSHIGRRVEIDWLDDLPDNSLEYESWAVVDPHDTSNIQWAMNKIAVAREHGFWLHVNPGIRSRLESIAEG